MHPETKTTIDLPPVLLFLDGSCLLCHRVGSWVARRDKHNHIFFTALQYSESQSFLYSQGYPLPAEEDRYSTVLLWDEKQLWEKSEAVIHLCRHFPFPWPWLAQAFGWIPRRIRDAAYSFVAKRRWVLFGKSEICSLTGTIDSSRLWHWTKTEN